MWADGLEMRAHTRLVLGYKMESVGLGGFSMIRPTSRLAEYYSDDIRAAVLSSDLGVADIEIPVDKGG